MSLYEHNYSMTKFFNECMMFVWFDKLKIGNFLVISVLPHFTGTEHVFVIKQLQAQIILTVYYFKLAAHNLVSKKV